VRGNPAEMWLGGIAIRCPELAAGEGQNQPQLRIMLGNCCQVNEKKGLTRRVQTRSAGVPAGCREGVSPSLFESKKKGPISRASN
jgi:hypothetical protein